MEFEVKTGRMKGIASDEKNIQKTLNSLNSELENTRRNLRNCLSSSASGSVDRAISTVHTRVGNTAGKVGTMGDKLVDIAGQYEAVERDILGQKVGVAKVAGAKSGEESQGKNEALDYNYEVLKKLLAILGIDETMWGRTKDFASLLSKVMDQINDASSVVMLGDSLSYLDDLWKLLNGAKKGDLGTDTIFDLIKDGGEVWNGLYKYLDEGLLKKSKTGGETILGNKFGNTVGYVGLAAAFAGFLKNYKETFEGEYSSWQEQLGAWIDTSGDGVGVVKKAYDVANMSKGVVSKSAKGAGGWFTLAETGFDFVGQAFKSYGKYNNDGVITVTEGSEIAIESAVKGLTTLTKGVTFGIVDLDANSLSSALEGGATKVSYGIAGTIKTNPEMARKFANGNIFESLYAFGWGTVHTIFK